MDESDDIILWRTVHDYYAGLVCSKKMKLAEVPVRFRKTPMMPGRYCWDSQTVRDVVEDESVDIDSVGVVLKYAPAQFFDDEFVARHVKNPYMVKWIDGDELLDISLECKVSCVLADPRYIRLIRRDEMSEGLIRNIFSALRWIEWDPIASGFRLPDKYKTEEFVSELFKYSPFAVLWETNPHDARVQHAIMRNNGVCKWILNRSFNVNPSLKVLYCVAMFNPKYIINLPLIISDPKITCDNSVCMCACYQDVWVKHICRYGLVHIAPAVWEYEVDEIVFMYRVAHRWAGGVKDRHRGIRRTIDLHPPEQRDKREIVLTRLKELGLWDSPNWKECKKTNKIG